MAAPAWNITGQYYETCNCDFVCPCLPGKMAVSPTKGSCTFVMAFEIERGNYGSLPLDGLGFIVLGFTPSAVLPSSIVAMPPGASATHLQRQRLSNVPT